MKASELRAGNWALMKYEKFNAEGNYFDANIVTPKDIEYCEQHPDNYLPIELTDEWLRKLGFEHEGQVAGRLKLDCDFGEVLIPLKNPKEICKYVHQLQNLYFALTGKELISI